MHELTKLLMDDMKPALGVTEPGAIAFAVAKAKTYIEGELKYVKVTMNSGMYKNAFTCGIPGSEKSGAVYSAAFGYVAGDSEKGLESLSGMTAEEESQGRQLVDEGKIKIEMSGITSRIFIQAEVAAESGTAIVTIKDSHTNIVSILANGEVVFGEATQSAELKGEATQSAEGMETSPGNTAQKDGKSNTAQDDEKGSVDAIKTISIKEAIASHGDLLIHRYTLGSLIEYVDTVDIEELYFIRAAFETNLALLHKGLASGETTFAERLLEENGGAEISEDEQTTAQLLCNGAIESRVIGIDAPAMSITGSGAHGIIATMPLYAAYKVSALKAEAQKEVSAKEDASQAEAPNEGSLKVEAPNEGSLKVEAPKEGSADTVSEEKLLRATALSYLICTYIKEYSGKLSAFCGCGIAAGTGMACALCYMKGGDIDAIIRTMNNMAASITGMICDGGNQGCTMKGVAAVDAAYRSVDFALHDVCIAKEHSIIGSTPELTMRNMGLIAAPGMAGTEKTIVEIFEDKL